MVFQKELMLFLTFMKTISVLQTNRACKNLKERANHPMESSTVIKRKQK